MSCCAYDTHRDCGGGADRTARWEFEFSYRDGGSTLSCCAYRVTVLPPPSEPHVVPQLSVRLENAQGEACSSGTVFMLCMCAVSCDCLS